MLYGTSPIQSVPHSRYSADSPNSLHFPNGVRCENCHIETKIPGSPSPFPPPTNSRHGVLPAPIPFSDSSGIRPDKSRSSARVHASSHGELPSTRLCCNATYQNVVRTLIETLRRAVAIRHAELRHLVQNSVADSRPYRHQRPNGTYATVAGSVYLWVRDRGAPSILCCR